MGFAKAECGVSGVGSAFDADVNIWFVAANAAAATYTYQWFRLVDFTTFDFGPLGPAAKFAPGPPPGPLAWPTNFLPPLTGPLGSTASVTQAGTGGVSPPGRAQFYFAQFDASATTSAAPGGIAVASSAVYDSWDVLALPSRRQRYLCLDATPAPVLTPGGGGGSTFVLSGSFGEIRLGLDGASNAPSCEVRLEPGWTVHLDGPERTTGVTPAPSSPVDVDALKQLFLDQHDPADPTWSWRRPPPKLTFIKPLPAHVTREKVEVSVFVEDEEAAPVEPRRREREVF